MADDPRLREIDRIYKQIEDIDDNIYYYGRNNSDFGRQKEAEFRQKRDQLSAKIDSIRNDIEKDRIEKEAAKQRAKEEQFKQMTEEIKAVSNEKLGDRINEMSEKIFKTKDKLFEIHGKLDDRYLPSAERRNYQRDEKMYEAELADLNREYEVLQKEKETRVKAQEEVERNKSPESLESDRQREERTINELRGELNALEEKESQGTYMREEREDFGRRKTELKQAIAHHISSLDKIEVAIGEKVPMASSPSEENIERYDTKGTEEIVAAYDKLQKEKKSEEKAAEKEDLVELKGLLEEQQQLGLRQQEIQQRIDELTKKTEMSVQTESKDAELAAMLNENVPAVNKEVANQK